MTWYFDGFLLQLVEHLDSGRFPLIVVCFVNMEIEFDMGKYVLVNSRMKVCDGESKVSKSSFHKILKIVDGVAGCNSNNRSGKGLHDVSCIKLKNRAIRFNFYIVELYKN